MLVINFPSISLIKDSAKYIPGISSVLDINLWPIDLVGNFTIFSDLGFRVYLQFSLLILSALGSNFTTTSPMIIR